MLRYILNLFIGKAKASEPQKTEKKTSPPLEQDIEFITVNDILSSSGRYKERLKSPELTVDVRVNATELARKVNKLLNDLGYKGKVSVSSGFRPASVNSKIKNAAKRSLHQIGRAVDLRTQEVGLLLTKKPELLKKHELWLEDLSATKTWTHLDDSPTRKDRPIRIFKP